MLCSQLGDYEKTLSEMEKVFSHTLFTYFHWKVKIP